MKCKFIGLIIILLCYSSLANAQQQKQLNEYFTAQQNLNQFNGSVLVAKGNKIIFQNTYNINDLQDSFKATPQSKFIIASVSKVFIKIAILKLQEQGKLNINDTIGKYIPNFPNGNKITIEQLVLHKSGLPREIKNYENYNSLTLNQVIELAKKETLMFEPNSQTAYSNIGYFLLHYIIEKSSNKGYFKFMQENIFNRLNLKNTFEYNRAKNKLNFVYGFTNENESIEATETKTINQIETGNIITTINDIFVFSKKISSSNFLTQKSKAFLFQNDSSLVQAGGRKGYRAYFQINLKNKTTILLLSNQSNIPFDEIVKETNNIIENRPYNLPKRLERKEMELSVDILKKHEGIYVSTEHNLHFTIKLIEKNLIVIETNGNQTKLYAETENSFFANPKSSDSYTFLSNEKGEISAFQILTNGMKIVLQKQN